MTEAGHRHRRASARSLLAREGGQRVAGPDLQQHRLALVVDERPHPVREAHGPPQVPRPVIRVGGFRGGNPRPGDVRHEAAPGRVHRDLRHVLPEGGQHRLHHRGMESMGRVKPSSGDAAGGQVAL